MNNMNNGRNCNSLRLRYSVVSRDVSSEGEILLIKMFTTDRLLTFKKRNFTCVFVNIVAYFYYKDKIAVQILTAKMLVQP